MAANSGEHLAGQSQSASMVSGHNEHLVGAAPDLLSARRGLLECAETGVTSLGTLRMARTAIAKAEGHSLHGTDGEARARRTPC